MSLIVVERDHSLGLETAKAKADGLAHKLQDRLGVEHQWDGDVLQLHRRGVQGSIWGAPDRVRIELTLSTLLSAMSGAIQAQIEQTLDKALQA